MKFEAVLFDCDGVLIDSEPITNGVLRDMLQEHGWTLTAPECMKLFIGKTLKGEKDLIEKHTGVQVDANWLNTFQNRRNAALAHAVTAIPDVMAAVHRVHTHLNGRIACASGSDRQKIEMMFNRTGMMKYFEGRIFSGYEVPRSKPFPDVYLAAAADLQVKPQHCAVVEDTVIGVAAGAATGATVFGFLPPGTGHVDAAALMQAGASRVFAQMSDLPDLLGC